MTSLSTRFFGQPSESRYSDGLSDKVVFCIRVLRRGTRYNRLAVGIQPAPVQAGGAGGWPSEAYVATDSSGERRAHSSNWTGSCAQISGTATLRTDENPNQ